MLNVTAKIQILPSPKQQQILFDTMKAYKNVFNFVSDYIFETHNLVQASVNRALYYDTRLRFGLRSQMSQSVQKTVITKYKTILETAEKWIKPTFQKSQYDLVWNRDYSLTEGLFSVNTLQGRIKVAFYSEGMEQYFDGSLEFWYCETYQQKI